MSHGSGHPPFERNGYEPNAASVKTILVFGLLVLGLIPIAFAGVALQMHFVQANEPDRLGANAPGDLRPPVRVESWATPTLDLVAVRQHEKENLTGYGWIDQSAGVVRIPIERAMELVAKQPTTQPSRGAK